MREREEKKKKRYKEMLEFGKKMLDSAVGDAEKAKFLLSYKSAPINLFQQWPVLSASSAENAAAGGAKWEALCKWNAHALPSGWRDCCGN